MLDQIKWISENGFDFVELFFEEDQGDPRYLDPKNIRKCLDTYKLDVIGHSAWVLPIGSEFKELREVGVSIIKRYIQFCHAIDCSKLVVHAHWPSVLFTPEEGIRFQTESLHYITDFALRHQVKILYESVTTKHDHLNNIRQILSLNPEIDFHVDIGHLHLWGRDPIQYLKEFKDRVGHIHMHDNDGVSDLHLPIGVGKIDWEPLIRLLKSFYDGTITLEIFSRDKDYVLMSKQKLLKLWTKNN